MDSVSTGENVKLNRLGANHLSICLGDVLEMDSVVEDITVGETLEGMTPGEMKTLVSESYHDEGQVAPKVQNNVQGAAKVEATRHETEGKIQETLGVSKEAAKKITDEGKPLDDSDVSWQMPMVLVGVAVAGSLLFIYFAK